MSEEHISRHSRERLRPSRGRPVAAEPGGRDIDKLETTVAEVLEGLLMFNEPLLNSRFHAMLDRFADEAGVEELHRVPALVTAAERRVRRTAMDWVRLADAHTARRFTGRAERAIMESFLGLIESEITAITFMARNAPTHETRKPFDEAAESHREVAAILRKTLSRMSVQSVQDPDGGERLRSVQEEEPMGDLRSQVEDAVRAASRDPAGIRVVTLSHTAVRHLRDQGCFKDGGTTILGVPVEVDMGWDAPAFAIRTFDVMPLDEIMDAHWKE